MKDSVKREAILILVTVALEKNGESGLAFVPGCNHS